MSHIAKFGRFQEREPFLTICTQLKVFMPALLQSVEIQKMVCREEITPGKDKKGDFTLL